MKRSKTMVITTIMAGASVSLTACGTAATQWGEGDIGGKPVDVQSYTSVAECKAAGATPAADCDRAYAQAQAANAENAPRFEDRQTCEEKHGVDQCVPRNNSGGGSFFTPLLTGFIIGQALGGGRGFGGAPMYRDRQGNFFGGAGGRISRDYATGRTQIGSNAFNPSARAPVRMQSRSSVISRGGFGGGGGRGFGG